MGVDADLYLLFLTMSVTEGVLFPFFDVSAVTAPSKYVNSFKLMAYMFVQVKASVTEDRVLFCDTIVAFVCCVNLDIPLSPFFKRPPQSLLLV